MLKLEWHDEITSTADVLCARARGGSAAHGTLLAAGSQTHGHGRGGQEKPFFSPPGGCYMSLLLHRDAYPCLLPPASCLLPPASCLLATLRAALAARRVLARHGCRVGVKWVNDLFLGPKKAGGILVQAAGDCVVISCGVNLYSTKVPPPELRGVITSCFDAPVCPKTFARELAEEIMALCAAQNSEALLDEYRAASIVLGREITYEENGLRRHAKALDITSAGGLIIRESNREKILTSGSITLTPTS